MARIFGEIPGHPLGTVFESRRSLSEAGLHKPIVGGISGAVGEGADSIVLSGGYEDDIDLGDEIVYTGHGGRDEKTGQQVADQQFTRGNAALAHNKVAGLPVRVIRGSQLDSPYAPQSGYRYDGLYRVDQFWEEVGKSGFKIWRFHLAESDGAKRPPLKPGAEEPAPPPRKQFTTTRVVRDSEKSRRVKQIYDYTCQVCGIRLDTPAGAYAEGAHIKPLGNPHNGPDVEANILCLCPNHHVLFDDGAVALTDEFRLLGIPGEPLLVLRHEVRLDFVRYHRKHFGVLVEH